MGSKAPSRVRIPHSPPPLYSESSRRRARTRVAASIRGSGIAGTRTSKGNDRNGIRHDVLTDTFRIGKIPLLHHAPVAQLDRAPGYELGGRRFESFRARHTPRKSRRFPSAFLLRACLGRFGRRRMSPQCGAGASRERLSPMEISPIARLHATSRGQRGHRRRMRISSRLAPSARAANAGACRSRPLRSRRGTRVSCR